MQQFATELFEHVTVTYIVLFLAYFSLLLSWPRILMAGKTLSSPSTHAALQLRFQLAGDCQ
jgi:hypothetical protein